MKTMFMQLAVAVGIMSCLIRVGNAQDVKASKSEKWSLSGRVQLQHVYNDQFKSEDSRTNNGFRVRRGRLQFKGKMTSWIEARIQAEIRDNAPDLKDAEGIVTMFKNYYFRFGQFKVPVWREEYQRSSGSLLLVERSPASAFLLLNLLSARHVGLEFGGQPGKRFSFAVNYNNGAGEGGNEIGRTKTDRLNNGKMYVGRVDFNVSDVFKVGLSGALNNLGNKTDSTDSGNNTVLAPDFGIYLPTGFDIEGGFGFGKISKGFLGIFNDQKYTLWDVTIRWQKELPEVLQDWGGLNGVEFAAGISGVNTNAENSEERLSVRFGPAIYFGKNARLQSNVEIVEPENPQEDNFFRIRSQFTFNF